MHPVVRHLVLKVLLHRLGLFTFGALALSCACAANARGHTISSELDSVHVPVPHVQLEELRSGKQPLCSRRACRGPRALGLADPGALLSATCVLSNDAVHHGDDTALHATCGVPSECRPHDTWGKRVVAGKNTRYCQALSCSRLIVPITMTMNVLNLPLFEHFSH